MCQRRSHKDPLTPVTVKLSKQFYDKLGHEIVDELVAWINQVDATYRGELRELNELSYARFEAKLEQRITELRLEIGRLEERMVARFDAIDARFGTVDGRLKAMEGTLDRFEAMEGTLDSRFDAMEQRLMASLATHKASMVRWMVGFWLATVIPVLGLVAALMR